MLPNIHIITYGTDESKMQQLKQSVDRQNQSINSETDDKYINYIFVGVNCKWNGYVDKITQISEAIKSIPDTDIICFTDAYDVLVFSGADEIRLKFLEYKRDLVLSAELNCYPGENEGWYRDMYQNNPHVLCPNNYKYVNSGGYIGYKHAINALFTWNPLDEIRRISELGGDQNYFTHYYIVNAKTNRVCLDYNCSIFQSIYKLDYDSIDFLRYVGDPSITKQGQQCHEQVYGRVYNNVLKQMPCFIHFNGYGGYWNLIQRISDNLQINVGEFFLNNTDKDVQTMDSLSNYKPLYYNQYPNIPQI